MSRVNDFYADHGLQFDRERSRHLPERAWLAQVAARAPAPAAVLDLGCGGGEPIARWFLEQGYTVTGLDAEPSLLALCRQRFPGATWRQADMRTLDLGRTFEVLVAWDSFFHLEHADQRALFPRFREHLAVGGVLLFTSGPEHGESIGSLFGDALYHASLAPEEYRTLLSEHGFEVLLHRAEDPECGRHTVWLAQRVR